MRPRSARLSARALDVAALLVLAGCAALFAVGYPLANAGVHGGSDRDEALEVATRELLHGHYPYRAELSTHRPISPLPGELLLAAPFVLLGHGALQNVAWLTVYWLWCRRTFTARVDALSALVYPLMLAPVVVHEIVTGGDLLANSLWVGVLTAALLRTSARKLTVGSVAIALVWGVGLASRAHFMAIVPLVVVALYARIGRRNTLLLMIPAGLTTVLLPAFFWSIDPAHFTPLHTLRSLASIEAGWPLARWWVPGLTVGAALGLAAVVDGRRDAQVLNACAVVVCAPVLLSVVGGALSGDPHAFARHGWYALSGLFFGVLAYYSSGSSSREKIMG